MGTERQKRNARPHAVRSGPHLRPMALPKASSFVSQASISGTASGLRDSRGTICQLRLTYDTRHRSPADDNRVCPRAAKNSGLRASGRGLRMKTSARVLRTGCRPDGGEEVCDGVGDERHCMHQTSLIAPQSFHTHQQDHNTRRTRPCITPHITQHSTPPRPSRRHLHRK